MILFYSIPLAQRNSTIVQLKIPNAIVVLNITVLNFGFNKGIVPVTFHDQNRGFPVNEKNAYCFSISNSS